MNTLLRLVFTCLVAIGPWTIGWAADWPQWGGSAARNMFAEGEHVPAEFAPGDKRPDGSGIDLATTRNVRWIARLGSENYSTPTIADGRVFVGTNDFGLEDSRYPVTEGGLLLCLDEATGKLLWRLVSPKLQSSHKSSDFDEMDLGLCGSVTVDGDRAYLVTNRCDVLCLDVHGMANGNDGAFRDEGQYSVGPGKPAAQPGPLDADIVWQYNMLDELMLWPHDASNCSPLVYGDFVYVCTANGVDGEKCPFPLAPSLIVLDKRTGKLVAFDGEKIGTRMFHGQWSSPSAGVVNGRPLIFFGAGDGVCYAFDALTKPGPKAAPLKKVWWFQCNTPEHLVRDGKPIDYWAGDKRKKRGNNDDGKYVGPNEIIATPVFHNNRVYVATGQDPVHGRARATLTAIDATKTGNLNDAGCIWRYNDIDRSMSTVSIADGLVYLADRPGMIHCLEERTGKVVWTHDLRVDIWGSTLLADGKLFVPSRKALHVLAAGRQKKVLKQVRLGTPMWAAPVAANNTLYIASQKYLWAVADQAKPALPAAGQH